MTNVNVTCFIVSQFFYTKSDVIQKQELILIQILKINNKQQNYTSQLLENLKNVKYIPSLETTFGVLG